jgi:SAM-dependent methyltransferase
MPISDRILARVAGQLGHPRGLPGRLVGRALNRGNRAIVSHAINALAVPSGATVADIGFGGGIGLELLLPRVGPSGCVVGVDISAVMLADASRRFRQEIDSGRLVLHQAGIEGLPLPDASLDGVISVNTLYFLADTTPALHELRRVLRPAGRLVLGLGDPEAMARLPFTAHGFHLRPIPAVVEALHTAGLEVREHRRAGSAHRAYHVLVAVPV